MILRFSIWIQHMPSPSCPFSHVQPSRSSNQWSCLDCVTRLVGQLISEEDPMWLSGTKLAIVALWHCKALFFEVCHIEIWPVSSLMETC